MTSVEISADSQSELKTASNSTWRDWMGIVASVGCAIHCAAMPFVIAYLPAWGLSFLADESFHKWMALICFLIATAAFVPGIRKHGNWLPISIGAFGLVFITFAAFGLAGECCPACEEKKSSPQSESVVATSGCENCEHCEECQQTESAHSSEDASLVGVASDVETEKNWLSRLAPWITPFGGLLLVSAHLLNRRMGYLCSCCVSKSSLENAE